MMKAWILSQKTKGKRGIILTPFPYRDTWCDS